MKQLTELKDGQKVLIAMTVRITDDSDFPYDIVYKHNSIFDSLRKDLKYDNSSEESEEIYDFNEVMNQKQEMPIVSKIYEFSDDEENWETGKFDGFQMIVNNNPNETIRKVKTYIREKEYINDEILKAIELLEQNNFEVKKK